MKGSGISSPKRKGKGAPSYASAASFLQNQLDEIGSDTERLEEFKANLEYEVLKGSNKSENLLLLGRVTERLSALQRSPDLANLDRNPDQFDDLKVPTKVAKVGSMSMTEAKEVENSDDDDEDAEMEDNEDEDMDEDGDEEEVKTEEEGEEEEEKKEEEERMDDDGDEDDEENKEEEEEEEKTDDDGDEDEEESEEEDGEEEEEDGEKEEEGEEKDPIKRQIKRAMRQLAALQATIRKRLVRTKQRLDKGTVASTDDDVLTKLDKAIALIDLHFASKSKTKSLLLKSATSVAAEQKDLVLSLTDIQTMIDESHEYLEVKKALAEGIVKPFFHTLLLPETFLNNRRSWNKVTPGEVDKDKPALTLEAFGENLNDVVMTVDTSGNEQGAQSIIDKGLKEGEDIECTELKSFPIGISDGAMADTAILTRPESRGVVANIFQRFAKKLTKGSVAAITGSPGIGKSWTLFYALQQALHYDGATVLFFFQKSHDAVMCLRRNNKVYAWHSKCSSAADSSLFSRSDVLVLLDPKEAKEVGANFNVGKQKLLYAASNNEGHFKNSAEKENGSIRFYLGPPMDSELYVILPHLNPKLRRRGIEKRKKNVGNLIRYIVDKDKYNSRIEATAVAVKECDEDPAKLQRALDMDGISAGNRTIPGTLFQVLPRRPENAASVGYDGQNVLYRELVVLAANDEVRNAIVKAGRKMILTYWGKVDGAEYARMGAEAEKLFIKDLTNDGGVIR